MKLKRILAFFLLICILVFSVACTDPKDGKEDESDPVSLSDRLVVEELPQYTVIVSETICIVSFTLNYSFANSDSKKMLFEKCQKIFSNWEIDLFIEMRIIFSFTNYSKNQNLSILSFCFWQKLTKLRRHYHRWREL